MATVDEDTATKTAPDIQPAAALSPPVPIARPATAHRISTSSRSAVNTTPVTPARSGLGAADDWLAAAFFVAVAASSVATPILAYAAAGHRLDDTLARLKDWMDKHNAALLAAVLVVIGAMILYHGIDALAGHR